MSPLECIVQDIAENLVHVLGIAANSQPIFDVAPHRNAFVSVDVRQNENEVVDTWAKRYVSLRYLPNRRFARVGKVMADTAIDALDQIPQTSVRIVIVVQAKRQAGDRRFLVRAPYWQNGHAYPQVCVRSTL